MQYQREIKVTIHLFVWTLAWTATVALAMFGPGHLWDRQLPVMTWTAVALNFAVGIGWIISITRYLRGIDELQRKILQDALVVTLGLGWVGWFAYIIADAAGVIAVDLNIAVFPITITVIFMIAFVVGRFRYR